jgi:hypothetical protein
MDLCKGADADGGASNELLSVEWVSLVVPSDMVLVFVLLLVVMMVVMLVVVRAVVVVGVLVVGLVALEDILDTENALDRMDQWVGLSRVGHFLEVGGRDQGYLGCLLE